eukprot:TRINITY_DN724_c0_g1_i11.p1 TRINITY_DN724_c0_g1~~TRINITY_DN724_c0_g1_i11.p1  ORF type:complete len:401 (+),score=78.43 TRINITY_DN724_c0_g1_i11:57-1259(+)
MLTLLLAAAACASPGQCEDYGDSTTYEVVNGTSAALGYTPAGDGVVAVCVSTFVHLLNASTGAVMHVTTGWCASSIFIDRPLMMNGQSVVSVASVYSVLRYDVLTFLPLTGGAPVTRKISRAICTASNGESLSVVGLNDYSAGRPQFPVEVYDNQGTLQQSLELEGRPEDVAVSKLIGNSTSSDYYVAVGFVGLPLTVYDSNGDIVASYTLRRDPFFSGMKFRDEDNSLVLAEFSETIVFNIETGASTTSSLPDQYSFGVLVAFNDDGSKIFANLQSLQGGAPRVYVRDVDTGDGRMLCTMDDDAPWITGVSFATDGQGRSVVLTYSQKADSAPLKVSVFNVPGQSTTSSTAPIGAIIGGVLGGVALLVAAGVGFWLWKKRQAAPEETYVDMASVEPTVN